MKQLLLYMHRWDILDTSGSISQMFADGEVIFWDDNESCHQAKNVKTFLQEKHINSMKWHENGLFFVLKIYFI